MSSLTRTAYLTKQFLIVGVIIVGILIGLRIFWGLGKQIWGSISPAATPTPSVNFGQLPSINFSGAPLATSSAKISYQIETIEGKLPQLPTQAKVFKINQPPPSILSGEKAKQQAYKLGFSSNPKQLSDTIYTFQDTTIYGRTLTFDIVTGSFSITSDLYQFPEILNYTGQLKPQDAINEAKKFLQEYTTSISDLPNEKIQTTLLKLEGRNLIEAKSIGETQLIRVNFYRQDLEKLPVLPLEKDKANVWVLVSPLKEPKKRIVGVNFTYWPVDINMWATYPLKTSQEAFEELQQGKAKIISGKGPIVTLRKIYLAYIETKIAPDFLQPVLVFDGDGNFRAFVPAIQSNWIKS